MRRADRLFRIIQILRRHRRPVTAAAMAEELECTVRTVYRDVAQLMADRVPIRGEAGIGYVLDGGFDMPPLMFTADEVEAAILGAQWVMARGDAALARAAADLTAKITHVVPEPLRPLMLEPALSVPPQFDPVPDAIDMARLRLAIRNQEKLRLTYRDEAGAETQRIVWPFAVAYFDAVRLIATWCELRQTFRHFRTDRIVACDFLAERYRTSRTRLKSAWRKEMEHASPHRAVRAL